MTLEAVFSYKPIGLHSQDMILINASRATGLLTFYAVSEFLGQCTVKFGDKVKIKLTFLQGRITPLNLNRTCLTF